MQAAFLSIKLKHFDLKNQYRRELAALYLNGISNPKIQLPVPLNANFTIENNTEHVWHFFVVHCKERDRLQAFLTENGIQTLIHYPIPPNKQLAYAKMNQLDFLMTNLMHNEVLSLPMTPVMTSEEILTSISSINKFS